MQENMRISNNKTTGLTYLFNKTIKKRNGPTYCKDIVTFDIETTNTYHEGNKVAYMYAFGICINSSYVYIGRTWTDFIEMITLIKNHLGLNKDKHLIIWVHNLAFEFQFIRDLFVWESVFSIDNRTPIKAVTFDGIEFRCSYVLSGYSLASVAKNLVAHDVKKLVGNLDYDLIHNPTTPLTQLEIDYLVNDVVIVSYYIEEQISEYKNILRIPLTNTGRVRKHIFNATMYTKDKKGRAVKNRKYIDLIQSLTISQDEYLQLKRGFQGGFTHANVMYVGKTVDDVTSYDFTSSYPAVMLSEKFPMSKGTVITLKDKNDFIYHIDNNACLFDVTFYDLEENIELYDNPLSFSKCKVSGDYELNNGRIVSAKQVTTTLTEVDYKIIRTFYHFSKMTVKNFRVYKKDYLPKPFIEAILELYKNKTTLKGVSGSEVEYQRSKGMLNSCYGMCVTDVAKDEIIFNGSEWYTKAVDVDKVLENYNKSYKRTLFYPWGVWITAYARRNLFTAIYTIGEDYIYSDTDSVKIKNADKYQDYFNKYNQAVISKVSKCLEYYKIDIESAAPKTIKGSSKPIGVWDYDGHYKQFKTLGAKRYMCTYDDDSLHITIAGLGKERGCNYIKKQNNPYDFFNDGMSVPAEDTGKLTHTYIDSTDDDNFIQQCDITDYQGNTETITLTSFVHLEKAPFQITIQPAFKDYIIKVLEEKQLGRK